MRVTLAGERRGACVTLNLRGADAIGKRSVGKNGR
jgi:hypothetical protein